MDASRVLATFFELPFVLAPGRVFSPRPATEQLVRATLERIDEAPKRVADVGTGSGAIAVALAVHRPQIEVWAIDTSRDALQLAHENAALNGVAERVQVVYGDLLEPVPVAMDVVVASLPQLPASLQDARYDSEPDDAIYAPGDGLDPSRRLLKQCSEGRLARPSGVVVIQIDRKPLAANWSQLDNLRAELDPRVEEAA